MIRRKCFKDYVPATGQVRNIAWSDITLGQSNLMLDCRNDEALHFVCCRVQPSQYALKVTTKTWLKDAFDERNSESDLPHGLRYFPEVLRPGISPEKVRFDSTPSERSDDIALSRQRRGLLCLAMGVGVRCRTQRPLAGGSDLGLQRRIPLVTSRNQWTLPKCGLAGCIFTCASSYCSSRRSHPLSSLRSEVGSNLDFLEGHDVIRMSPVQVTLTSLLLPDDQVRAQLLVEERAERPPCVVDWGHPERPALDPRDTVGSIPAGLLREFEELARREEEDRRLAEEREREEALAKERTEKAAQKREAVLAREHVKERRSGVDKGVKRETDGLGGVAQATEPGGGAVAEAGGKLLGDKILGDLERKGGTTEAEDGVDDIVLTVKPLTLANLRGKGYSRVDQATDTVANKVVETGSEGLDVRLKKKPAPGKGG